MKPSLAQLKQLVGNPDAYAVQHVDGGWTPVRHPLNAAVLQDHLDGEMTVGTYIVKDLDQARTLVFDIDAEGQEAREQTDAVVRTLRSLGIKSGVEFSGRKGYHVWVVADGYMPAKTLYAIGRGVRAEVGLDKMEVFPKQTEVRDLGNLVKLPGGVHRVSGKRNDFLTDFPEVTGREGLEVAATQYPEVAARKTRNGTGGPEYPCVHKLQDGVAEGGRNIHLFHLATMLRKFSLSDEAVEDIVRRANEKSLPPLEESEIIALLDNSRFSGPTCDQLTPEYHCGEQCIKARHPGLYTRTGALRYGANGEAVVLEITGRGDDGRVVEVSHPDAVQGRVSLVNPKP